MAELQKIRKRKEPEVASSSPETQIDPPNEVTGKRRNETGREFAQTPQLTNNSELRVATDVKVTSSNEQQTTVTESTANPSVTTDTYSDQRTVSLRPLGEGGLSTVLHRPASPPPLSSPVSDISATVNSTSSREGMTSVGALTLQPQLYPTLPTSRVNRSDNSGVSATVYSPLSPTYTLLSSYFDLLRGIASEQSDRLRSTPILLEEHHKFQTPRSESSEFYRAVRTYFDSQLQLANILTEIETKEAEAQCVHEHEVWTEQRETVTLQPTKCGDNTTVSPPPVEMTWMTYNASKAHLLRSLLTKVRQLKSEGYTQFLYSTQMAKLRMQQLVDEFLYQSHLFSQNKGTLSTQPVVTLEDECREPADVLEVQTLKHYLDVLFSFIRDCEELIATTKQPTGTNTNRINTAVKEFYEDIKFCATKLLAAWLRQATYSDHVYILRHLIATPNIHLWGTSFLQFSVAQNWQRRDIDHFLTMLHTLLCPVVKSLATASPSQVLPLLHEDDYIALFKQFPFPSLYQYLFGSAVAPDKIVDNALVTFDYCDSLVSILSSSLSTFAFRSMTASPGAQGETPQLLYRHFLRRIAETLLDVTRHAAFFTEHTVSKLAIAFSSAQISFITSRWELLFAKIFSRLLNQKSTEIWQFLVHLPYKTLSPPLAFNLFYLIFQQSNAPLNDQLVENFCRMSLKDWNDSLQSNMTLREGFIQKLAQTKESEFLLHTLTKLALVQPSPSPLSLVILNELFYVAYIHPQTRGHFHKSVREMISSIVRAHPHFMSELLKLVDGQYVALGNGSLHLFKSLPLSTFIPTSDDLQFIEKWLLSPLEGSLCKLAQFIVEQLPWRSPPDNTAPDETKSVLPDEVHRRVALILLRAYLHHKDQQSSTFVSFQKTPSSRFFDWVLTAVLLPSHFTSPGKRCLAPLELSDPLVALLTKYLPTEEQMQAFVTQTGTAPNVSFPLDPLVSYLALQLTSIGHNHSVFKRYGLFLLRSLIAHQKYDFVLRVLYEVLPAVISPDVTVTTSFRTPNDNIRFCRDILKPLLGGTLPKELSSSVWNYIQPIPFEITKNNEITVHVAAMITSQIFSVFRCRHPQSREHARNLLNFWLRETFEQEEWRKDDQMLHLADSLIRCAVAIDAIDDVYNLLLTQQRARATKTPKTGVVSRLLSSLKESSKYLSELFANKKLQAVLYPWASLFILLTEVHMQRENWQQLGELITNKPTLPLDTILKDFGDGEKWAISKVLDRAMVMDPDHPLTVLFWQLFFVLYFSVSVNNGNFFAYKLFHSSDSKKQKSIRELVVERLSFLVQHHNSILDRYRVLQRTQGSTDANVIGATAVSTPSAMSSISPSGSIPSENVFEPHVAQLSAELIEYYRVMHEWTKLDVSAMNVHTVDHLPTQYAPFYLSALIKFNGPRDLWWQHIHNSNVVIVNLQKVHREWSATFHALNTRLSASLSRPSNKKSKQKSHPTSTGTNTLFLTSESSVSHRPQVVGVAASSVRTFTSASSQPQANVLPSLMPMIQRADVSQSAGAELRLFECSERSAPPPDCTIQPPLVQPYPLSSNISSLRRSLEEDINIVLTAADAYNQKLGQYITLDEELLELLPRLYILELKKLQREARCKQQCLQPAVYVIDIKETRKDLEVEKRIIRNRRYVTQVANFEFGVDLCYCCLRVEKTLLLLRAKKSRSEDDALVNFGVALFYWVMTKQTPNNRFYPPGRIFLDFLSISLAQTFLMGNAKEGINMLQTIVKEPQFVELLAPYFTPNASVEHFGRLYELVLAQVGRLNDYLIALLLSKFDVNEWLKATRTERELHVALLHLIGSHLCDESQKVISPTSPNPSNLMLSTSSFSSSQNKCLEHFKMIALFAFPQYFDVVTQYVFDMSRKRILLERVWSLVVELPLNTLTTSLLTKTFSWMANYFLAMKKRREKRRLYTTWNRYLPHLLRFVAQLLRALVNNEPRFTDPQFCQTLLSFYESWLYTPDGAPAWSPAESFYVQILLESFVNNMTLLQRVYPQLHVMNAVWQWWSGKEMQRRGAESTLPLSTVQPVSELTVEQQLLVAEQLLALPWETLLPQLDTPKEMLSLAHLYTSSPSLRPLPLSKFIARVVTRIDWSAFTPQHITPPSSTFSGYSSLSSPLHSGGSPTKSLTLSTLPASSTVTETNVTASAPSFTPPASDLPLYVKYYSMLFGLCCWYLSSPLDDTTLQQAFDHFVFSRAVHYPWHLLSTSHLRDSQLIQKYVVDKVISMVNPRATRNSADNVPLVEQLPLAERVNATLKFLHSICGWHSIESSSVDELLQRVDRLSLYLTTVVELLPLCFTKQNALATINSLYDMILTFASVALLNRPRVLTTITTTTTTSSSSPSLTVAVENSSFRAVEEAVVLFLRNVLTVYNHTSLVTIPELCTLLTNYELATATDTNPNNTNNVTGSESSRVQLNNRRYLGELSIYFLRAAALSIASESKQVPLIEICLENDFVLHLDVNRLTTNLIVPDIGRETFLQTCVETRAVLTLYVFCLQIMKRNDFAQLTKLLENIFEWIPHLSPPPAKEYKLFLVWDVAVQLSQIHVAHNFSIAKITKHLEQLSDYMLNLSEDRKSKGLLKFLNLGEKSPYPLEFRLTCRVLGLFLMIQVQGGQLRLNSIEPLKLSSAVQKRVENLRALCNQDKYLTHQFLLQSAVNFITNPEKTIAHFHSLLHMLTSALYKHPAIKALFF